MQSLRLNRPTPGRRAALALPGDKSISHRAFILAAVAHGRTRIQGVNRGLDVMATVRALRQLGVPITLMHGEYHVRGVDRFRDPRSAIDCGNSATTMRLLAGLLAGRVEAVLDGDASLRKRPMSRIAEPLNRMGGGVTTARAGRPPIRLRRAAATLAPIRYRLPVASAQLKSALLLAALRASGPSAIVEPATTRDHTEILLRAMCAKLTTKGRTLRISPSRLVAPGRLRIPGDVSAAVYVVCAAALLPGTRLLLRHVGVNPTRTAALDVLRRMGVRLGLSMLGSWSGEPVADIAVAGGAALRNVTVPARLVPQLIDEIPALCALAASARGTFSIRGAGELRVKESDRIATTVALLCSFGADARPLPDGIVVRGGRPLRAPRSVSTHGDHRLGFAAAILAAATRSALRIDDSACMATSFPSFAAIWRKAF